MYKIQIPATSANLGAGFDALGLALTFYNYVEIGESDTIDIASTDGLDVPTDEKNLIYISAKDLFNVCGKELKGLKLRQTNNIPMARGLGSSSACIIAGLVGANKLLGDPLTKDAANKARFGSGGPDYTIKGEFAANGFRNELKHDRGVLSMARAQHPESAGSQFFIMHADAAYLDGQYAAFGRVVKGIEVVDKIASVATNRWNNRPYEDQVIDTIRIVEE